MTREERLYFIALLPPQAIQDEVTSYKQHFAERYQSSHALKSPPHVTLQAPFKWHEDNQQVLEESLKTFADRFPPIPMILSGFDAFPPRVIYVNVIKTPELLSVQSELAAYLGSTLGIYDERSQGRPFSPHMTIAHKDLKKSQFKAGWKEYQNRPLFYQFSASHLTLLIHDRSQWNICAEYPFNPGDAERSPQ